MFYYHLLVMRTAFLKPKGETAGKGYGVSIENFNSCMHPPVSAMYTSLHSRGIL